MLPGAWLSTCSAMAAMDGAFAPGSAASCCAYTKHTAQEVALLVLLVGFVAYYCWLLKHAMCLPLSPVHQHMSAHCELLRKL